jgi:hypothetical protein
MESIWLIEFQPVYRKLEPVLCGSFDLLALAYQEGQDIVFRFIIEYSSSLRDFGP